MAVRCKFNFHRPDQVVITKKDERFELDLNRGNVVVQRGFNGGHVISR
jgi:hypothetical protein